MLAKRRRIARDESTSAYTRKLQSMQISGREPLCMAACACLVHNCPLLFTTGKGTNVSYTLGRFIVSGKFLKIEFEDYALCHKEESYKLADREDFEARNVVMDPLVDDLDDFKRRVTNSISRTWVRGYAEILTAEALCGRLCTTTVSDKLCSLFDTLAFVYTSLSAAYSKGMRTASALLGEANRGRSLTKSMFERNMCVMPNDMIIEHNLAKRCSTWKWYAQITGIRCQIYDETSNELYAGKSIVDINSIPHRMSVSRTPEGRARPSILMIELRHSTCDLCLEKAWSVTRDGYPHVSALAFVQTLMSTSNFTYELLEVDELSMCKIRYRVRAMHLHALSWVRGIMYGTGKACILGCHCAGSDATSRFTQDTMRTMSLSVIESRRALVLSTCEGVLRDLEAAVEVYQTGTVFLSTSEDRRTLSCIAACKAYFSWLVVQCKDDLRISRDATAYNLAHVVHAHNDRGKYVHTCLLPDPAITTSDSCEKADIDCDTHAHMFVCAPPGDIQSSTPVCFACRLQRCCCSLHVGTWLKKRSADLSCITRFKQACASASDMSVIASTLARPESAIWTEEQVAHVISTMLKKSVMKKFGMAATYESMSVRRMARNLKHEHLTVDVEVSEGVRLWNLLLAASQPRCPCCRTLSIRGEGCMHLCCAVCSTHYCSLCLRVYPNTHNPNGEELHGMMCRVGRKKIYSTFALGGAQTFAVLKAAIECDSTQYPDYKRAVERTPKAWLQEGMDYSDRFSHNASPFYHFCCPQYVEHIVEHERHREFGLFSSSYRTEIDSDLAEIASVAPGSADHSAALEMVYRMCCLFVRFDSMRHYGPDTVCTPASPEVRKDRSDSVCDGTDFTLWTIIGVVRHMMQHTTFKETLDECGWSPVSMLYFISKHTLAFKQTIMVMSGAPLAMLKRYHLDGDECLYPWLRSRWSTYVGLKLSACIVENMVVN